jgi:glycosyltransferase involved in cell wall biosynthesis
MKLLIVSDAWFPQVSGVVRTLSSTIDELCRQDHEVKVISPDQFPTIPCPSYPEIRLACWVGHKISGAIKEFDPDAIHIVTEGTLGLMARLYCARKRIPFTTSFTTRFPEYIYARYRIPVAFTYRLLRWFHAPSGALMVATNSLKKELEGKGFRNIVLWTRGVDVNLFHPREKNSLDDAKPILMYVGRVAIEKNIKAFLDLKVKGTKYVVGGGPQLESLKREYPDIRFVGMKHGEELARYYASADVFVFPSLTDTFGLVMLEALASGVPVAAYPVLGPLDVINNSGVGVLNRDLALAVRDALQISPEKCREYALQFSWTNVAKLFISNLKPLK